MSCEKVVEYALSLIGKSENPVGSNNTIFGEEYELNGVPWCVIFLWYIFNKTGAKNAFFGGGKTASCSSLLSYAKSFNLVVDKSDIRRGDIVFLNFNNQSSPDHCGIVEKVSGIIHTIEGNTTSDNSSVSAYVSKKERNLKQIVAVMRPVYVPEDCINSWAKEDIRKCYAHNLFSGFPDGLFRPKNIVTREELATVLARMVK